MPVPGTVLETLNDTSFSLATADDAEELSELFARFFNEAHYQDRGIVYSKTRAQKWLAGTMASGQTPHVVARKGDEIVGVCSFGLDNTFCERPVAILHTVYVLPGLRRTAIGFLLIVMAMDMAKAEGACAWHAPIASGLAEQKSLINLLKRCGCSDEIGIIIGRSL